MNESSKVRRQLVVMSDVEMNVQKHRQSHLKTLYSCKICADIVNLYQKTNKS